MSMPHAQQVIKARSSAGVPVVALALDDGEAIAGFRKWVTNMERTYPNLLFAYSEPEERVSAKLYQVSGIPTQYVLDKEGIIRASLVGYGGPTDDLAKAIRAASAR